jgi:hypothetical protein
MAIIAPLSRYKKQNFLIIAGVLLAGAIVFAYDGYLSKYEWSMRNKFYKDHVIDGVPDDTIVQNQALGPILFIGSAVVAGYFCIIKDKKIIADDNGIQVKGKTIPYEMIEKIDKSKFNSKGYFIVTYKDNGGDEQDIKISDRSYDNIPAVLDCVVEKIS